MQTSKGSLSRTWSYIIGILLVFIPVFTLHAVELEKTASGQGWREWGEAYFPEKPVQGGDFRVAAPIYIGLMNPNHFPVMDWVNMAYIYEKLIYLDGQFRPTIPWLAESWEYEDDVTVVMTLKQNVRFHDGTLFNASSLKYQMEWILNKDNLAWTRTWIEPLQSVEIINEYTVRWHFKRPWGAFLGTMASVPGFMISEKALRADADRAELKELSGKIGSIRRKAASGDTSAKTMQKEMEERLAHLTEAVQGLPSLDSHPVGTGPYMFDKASPGNYLHLKRNPDWWFGRSIGLPEMPYFETRKVMVIPDPSVRLANFKAGKLDFLVLNPLQYRMVKNDARMQTFTMPINWLVYMLLNHAKGPCADLRVRKAISHAIDREALVQGSQFGLGRVASCIYPENHWAHNSKLKPVPYDPELSKALLKDAGFAGGLKIRGFVYNSPESQAFAKAIMGMLEKVGIEWKPKFLGIAAMMEPLQRLDYDMIGSVYMWIQEPDHIASILYHPDSPFNNGRSRNPEVIRLIEEGRCEIDEKKRTVIYNKLEQALYSNCEDVWLWWPVAVMTANQNIRGFNVDMSRKWGEGYMFSHPTWYKNGKP